MSETPEEENARLRVVVESLQADLRWSNEARWRAVTAWMHAEQRLDLWIPLGAVAIAAVVTAVLGWIVGWV